MIDFQEKSIDVICQHTKDCKIIPLRIRLEDEDGNLQTYNIKWYKDTTPHSSFKIPSGIRVTTDIWSFECKILVLDTLRMIKLFYHSRDNKWAVIKA